MRKVQPSVLTFNPQNVGDVHPGYSLLHFGFGSSHAEERSRLESFHGAN